MPRFPEPFIQQVAQATDIVDLVSSYIALKRKGSEFVGLCPFHDDNKPSMTVSPAKQLFKCFACGAGGGVYQWLTMYDKLSFPEAVRTLAERAHIPLPEQVAGPIDASGPSKRDLVAVCEFAARFFQSQLHTPDGAGALEYIRSRRMTDESIRRFGIGFAPDSWDALGNAARGKGIGESLLVEAGLSARRESGGCYDRFRARLMLPICDASGNVIGFGGRALRDDQPAKYLNSPDTPLFDKSRNLYALNWSRQEIVNRSRAVVVEGYFDALMPLQAGVPNVVATLGTSLTEAHVRMLSRYAEDVVLIFDADQAGAKAAMRGLELFLRQQVHVRVATIPDGKDPCDFVLANGAQALDTLIDQAPDALAYVWNQSYAAIAGSGNLVRRQKQIDEFLRLIADSEAFGAIDAVQRGQLAQHIGHLLNIPAADLQDKLRQLTRRRPTRSGARPVARVSLTRGPTVLAQKHILEVLLCRPDLFDEVAERIDPGDFSDPALEQIARQCWRLGLDGHLRLEELLACEQLAQLGGLLAELAEVGQRRGNYEQTLAGAVECILYRRDRNEIEELKASAGRDDQMLRQLQSRLRRADLRKRPRIS